MLICKYHLGLKIDVNSSFTCTMYTNSHGSLEADAFGIEAINCDKSPYTEYRYMYFQLLNLMTEMVILKLLMHTKQHIFLIITKMYFFAV